MKTSIPKLHKIRMKNGGADISVFEPPVKSRIKEINFHFGKVTIEQYDYHLTNADCVYLLEAAKNKLMYGEEDE
jgi:hypothetical protein